MVEKTTRVKARVKAHALKEFMSQKDNVVVMGHKITDVDTFGAAIGIYRAAKTLNKKAYIVINNATSSIRPLMDEFINNPDYDPHMFVNSHEGKKTSRTIIRCLSLLTPTARVIRNVRNCCL